MEKIKHTEERDFSVDQLAGGDIRIFNFLIDTVLIILFTWGGTIAFTLENSSMLKLDENLSIPWIFISVFIFYYTLLEFYFGKTVGKFFTHTSVISDNGKKPTFEKIIIRSIARLIPLEPISCLIKDKAYGWHDNLSKTIVIPDIQLQS